MLTKIKIKPSYSTLEDDFASDFFIPVLSNSNRFYRVSAYFNSKSLSEYIEGMKFFAENKGKYKLIVSKEISNEEFVKCIQSFIDKKLKLISNRSK